MNSNKRIIPPPMAFRMGYLAQMQKRSISSCPFVFGYSGGHDKCWHLWRDGFLTAWRDRPDGRTWK